MAFIDRSTRVGRSQGASIFWGLVSVCFAAAACFYYLKNHDNERVADQMRDQAMQLREENESLASQKDHLQAAQEEAANELKTREDLVAQKETELAEEEQHLDELSQQSAVQSQENLAQVAIVKKFNDVIRKLGKDQPDVVERGGRPVLRVPNAQLFALGDATLTPGGKAMLNQIALALNNQLDHFDLRVVAYTDTDAEGDATGAKKDDPQSLAPPPDSKPHYANSWDLTAARAAAISRYFRDQTQLPFLSVLVMARGDSEPISSNAGDNHARNRRVEITVTPMPVSFHAPDTDATSPTVAPSAKTTPAPATTDSAPAPVKKAKPKKADTDQVEPPAKGNGR